MDISRTVRSWIGYIFLTIMLASCGGGEGDSSPQSRSIGTISGNVYDAPVSGSTVYIWEYQDGKLGRLLATTTTDAFGNYSADIESASMPLFVSAQGGAYKDPISNNIVSDNNGKIIQMDSVINYSEGVSQNLMVTPLTNIATGLAEYKISKGASAASAVTQALETVDDMYGFDVNVTTPIDITSGGQSGQATDGHKYGALLTAYSSVADDLKTDIPDSEKVYTSINLADIQYRDIAATGQLDGSEIDSSGMKADLFFGTTKVDSELYTNTMSRHVLIVANDPSLNVSGTPPSDYEEFSTKINQQGTPGHEGGGAVPPREEKPINSDPPEITRKDTDVLAGEADEIELEIIDDVGVQSIAAYLVYEKADGQKSELVECPVNSMGEEYCQLNLNGFQKGTRETSASVLVNTVKLSEHDEGVSRAWLVFSSVDVVGNKLEPNPNEGIEFFWDNDAPVIQFTSKLTISSNDPNYTLTGIVKDNSPGIDAVSIKFGNEEAKVTDCESLGIVNSVYQCEFEGKTRDKSEFSNEVSYFYVTAEDAYGNESSEEHTVSIDNTNPIQEFSYSPSPVNFVDDDGITSSDIFDDNTYPQDGVENSAGYLKINYRFAKENLRNIYSEIIDFENFSPSILQDNQIPYVKVVVSDPDGESLSGSSADRVNLRVTYSVDSGSGYSSKPPINSISSGDFVVGNTIPHETIMSEDKVDQVIYYVPLTRDILGSSFANVTKDAAQKLTFKTIDESGNESETKEIYFRTTFDLPTITVVTPFIGVSAQLEGLTENNKFTTLASCSTVQQNEPDQKARDVASCPLLVKDTSYNFMRIRLTTSSNSNTYYYQWKDSEESKTNIDLSSGSVNLGAYFELSGSQSIYITELASYQTGLFDYYWNQTSDKSPSVAKVILDEVNKTLAGETVDGSESDSVFGFNPIETEYATNETLRKTDSINLNSKIFQHRFLAEALSDLASAETYENNNSLDFAKAFYVDLSTDGTPDGNGGKVGEQFGIIDYQISEDTYRQDLASYYYQLLIGPYKIAESTALFYADKIAQANPEYDGVALFSEEGQSIDTQPPELKREIISGTYYLKGYATMWVKGAFTSRFSLTDPSGIVDGVNGPTFLPSYYTKTEPENALASNVAISEESGSTSHAKSYQFSLNTTDSSVEGITEFVIDVNASDYKGNTLNNEKLIYYVDNDYPVVEYMPPNGVMLPETAYLNGNVESILTFNVLDAVGDDVSKRKLIFVNNNNNNQRFSFNPDDFTTNDSSQFSVILCKDGCDGVYPADDDISGDGEWTVYAEAEDYLGNSVKITTSGAPRFSVNIDSQVPVFNLPETTTWLGGNAEWAPNSIIDWGELSDPGRLEVKLKRAGNTTETVPSCTEGVERTCLKGDFPNLTIQLYQDDYKYGDENQFVLTAEDSAYPPNKDTKNFKFKVDNKGPELTLASPEVTDGSTGESYVVGNKFTIHLESLKDDSGVDKIQVFQNGHEEPIKVVSIKSGPETDQSKDITLLDVDVEKITLSDSKQIALEVMATDVNGFESDILPLSPLLLDLDGPIIELAGYNSKDFYTSNYQFVVDTYDLGSDGKNSEEAVNTDKTRYWVYTGETPPDTSYGGSQLDEGKVTFSGLKQDSKILVKAVDVRGNDNTEEFLVQVNPSAPSVEYSIQYADGSELDDDKVTKSDMGLKLTLTASDMSGVTDPEVTYYYSDLQGASKTVKLTLDSGNEQDGVWQATIPAKDFAEDGQLILDLLAGNETKYIQQSDKLEWQEQVRLSIQRQKVELQVASNFATTMANDSLTVNFTLADDTISITSLECWVRNSYQGEGAPADTSSPYVKSASLSSCTIKSNDNFDAPVLITKAIGSNGSESVQTFSFAMIDVDPPTIETGESYQLQSGQITKGANDEKELAFSISFSDNLAGVDVSEQSKRPYLEKVNGKQQFIPSACTTSNDITTCTYSGAYTAFIKPNEAEHKFAIKNLSDLAGNSTSQSIELIKPSGNIDMAIYNPSPAGDNYIDEKLLTLGLRYKLYDNSELYRVETNVGGVLNTFTDSSSAKPCEDDPSYRCIELTSDVPTVSDGVTINISALVEDGWGITASDSISIKVDNQEPEIGAVKAVQTSPDDETKVRFWIDISDFSSGLQSVSYIITPDNRTSISDDLDIQSNEIKYFDIERSAFEGTSSVKVALTAFDNVDHKTSTTQTIDISAPKITLNPLRKTDIVGNSIVIKESPQDYSIETESSGLVSPASYTLELGSSSGYITETGNFEFGSAEGNWNFQTSQQGQYTLKISSIDTIGRESTGYFYEEKQYLSRNVYVDFEKPDIRLVSYKTIAEAGNGYYDVELYATISDANLNPNKVAAQFVSKDTKNTYMPTNVSQSDDDYIFQFKVPEGEYTATVTAVDMVENETIYELNVDNEGPQLTLATPEITDSSTGESYVMGRQFTIHIASLKDNSGVESVQVLQQGSDTPIKVVSVHSGPATDQPLQIALSTSDVDKIDTSNSTKITLQLKAIDVNGFESRVVSLSPFLLDSDGPIIELSGYDSSDYYASNYQFAVDTYDLDSNGKLSEDGVDTSKTRYWVYTGEVPPDTSYGGSALNQGNVILSNMQQDSKVIVKAFDVRGNEDSKEFLIQSRREVPAVEVSIQYADGSEIENNQVIKSETGLKLTLTASDVSGVSEPQVNYYYSEEQNTSKTTKFTLDSGSEQDGIWSATIQEKDFDKDGELVLEFSAGNGTKYINLSDKLEWQDKTTLAIQRQPIELQVSSDFASTIANTSLIVNFSLASEELSVTSLECWVRNNYQGNDVPKDAGPYVKSTSLSSCSIPFTVNFDDPVLITKTVGSNTLESVQTFRFSMVDVDPPTVETGERYLLQLSNLVGESSAEKQLSFDFAYSDNLSGVDTSDKSTLPYLEKKNGNQQFTPDSCLTESGITRCTYKGIYSDFIKAGETEHAFSIKNLSDIAGNSTEKAIELVKPSGSIEAAIYSPSAISDNYIDEKTLTLGLRYKLYDNSKVSSIETNVGGMQQTITDGTNVKSCQDDPSYQCVELTSPVPSVEDGAAINISVQVVDVWGVSASDSISIKIDNSAPEIGELTSVEANGESLVRFSFNISDSSSGLQSVKYAVTLDDQVTLDDIVKESGDALTSFDIDRSQLEGISSVKVVITATDKVGHEALDTQSLDISAPQITLNTLQNVGFMGESFVIKEMSQGYSMDTESSGAVGPASYTIELSGGSGDITESGNFELGSAEGSLNFQTSQQGQYTLKISSIDTIGREVAGYLYDGSQYLSHNVYVDFEKPQISLVRYKTIAEAGNGYYDVELYASISDANLNPDKVTAQLASKGTQNAYMPTNVSQSDDEYTFHFTVPEGQYVATVTSADMVENETIAEINIDNQGPELTLATPEITDSTTGDSYVMGSQFTIHLASLKDNSGVESVQVFQQGSDVPVKVVYVQSSPATEQSLDILLSVDDTDKIDRSNSTQIMLQLMATDVNGLASRVVPLSPFLLDLDGPNIELSGYDSSDYYASNYQFSVDMYDLGSDGKVSVEAVDTSETRYWVYTGDTPPDTSYGGSSLNQGNVVLSNMQQDSKVVVKAVDVRGNESITEFLVQVNDDAPMVEFNVQYADGRELENGLVTKSGTGLKLSLTTSDISSVYDPQVTYYYSGEQEASKTAKFTLDSGNEQDGVWVAIIEATDFDKDGQLVLELSAGNGTKYIDLSDKLEWWDQITLAVQRRPIELQVASDFSDTIASTSLTVNFTLANEDLSVTSLECWVRNKYQGSGVPNDDGPYVKSSSLSSCSIPFTDNFDDPVLITKAVGSNTLESVQTFRFSMVDIEPPIVESGEQYLLQLSNLGEGTSGEKILTFDLVYSDNLSGVDAIEKSKLPFLEKMNGKQQFYPKEEACKHSDGLVTCTYTGDYEDFIEPNETEHLFTIKNLVDKARNSATKSIELIEPSGSIEASIYSTSASSDGYIDENLLTLGLRYKLYDNSKLSSIETNVGDVQQTITEGFNTTSCQDDPSYLCIELTSPVPRVGDGADINVSIQATDIWGVSASDSVSLKVDNSAPEIGELTSVESNGESQVRFSFSISDASSGLYRVKYAVTLDDKVTLDDIVKENEDDLTSFDINRSDLEGVSSVKVEITAIDKVGHKAMDTKPVDISAPKLTLNALPNIGTVGESLVIKDSSQGYSIEAESLGAVGADSYTIELLGDSGDITESGNFEFGSAQGNWSFDNSQQGLYTLKISSIDTIGRENAGYLYDGNQYLSRNVYVDFEKLDVSIISYKTDGETGDGYYDFELYARIADANLNPDIVTAQLVPKDTTDPYIPTNISQSGDDYTFYFLVPEGEYTATLTATDMVENETTQIQEGIWVGEDNEGEQQ